MSSEQFFLNFMNTSSIIVFIGIGKSFLIGQTLAATIRSLGIESHCLNSADAVHGDLGILLNSSKKKLLVWLSKSGETEEAIRLFDYLNNLNFDLEHLLITGKEKSILAVKIKHKIIYSVQEAYFPSLSLIESQRIIYNILLNNLRPEWETSFRILHPGGKIEHLSKM